MVEANWLKRAFEEGEVYEMVKALNSDKGLDPNDFAMTFIQACWEVFKDDLMKVFHDFNAIGELKKSLMPLL